MDQLSKMITDLLVGATSDSTAGVLLSRFAPMIQQLVNTGISAATDSLIDARDSTGKKIKISKYAGKRNAVAAAYSRRLSEITASSDLIKDLTDGQRDKGIVTLLKSFGYSDTEANNALTSIEGHALKMIYNVAEGGKTEEAYRTMNNSIARRFELMDTTRKDDKGKITERQKYTKQLISDISDDFFKRRAFGEAELSDVSKVMSKLVGTGRYDNISGDSKRVAEKLRRDIKEYGDAFESLRTVFEGDYKQAISHMNRLTGGSVMSLSATQLRSTSNLYQHTALTTGIADRRLLELSKTMYTQGVMQGGGDERYAANAAALNSYMLASRDITAYGASRVGLERLAARFSGSSAASGENRELAAAYMAYRMRTSKDDSDTTFKEFRAALRKSGKNLGDFALDQLGGDQQRYMSLYSSRVLDPYVSDSRLNEITHRSNYERVAKGYEDIQNNLKLKLRLNDKQMSDLLGDNWRNMTASQISEKLVTSWKKTKLSQGEMQDVADEFSRSFNDLIVRENIVGQNYGDSEQFVVNARNWSRMRDAKLGDVDKIKSSRLSRNAGQAFMQVLSKHGSNANLRNLAAGVLHKIMLTPDGKLDTSGHGDVGPSGEIEKPSELRPGMINVTEAFRKGLTVNLNERKTDSNTEANAKKTTDDTKTQAEQGKQDSTSSPAVTTTVAMGGSQSSERMDVGLALLAKILDTLDSIKQQERA